MRTMYDSITAADIPADALMVAGYLCGRWAWSPDDWARFPDAELVGICVNSAHDHGDVGDVETGDMTPATFPQWRARRLTHGVDGVGYCNRANYDGVLLNLAAAGMTAAPIWLSTLDNVRDWRPHVVAVQYAGQALLGKHYDLSDVADTWPSRSRPRPDVLILLAPDGSQYLLSGSLFVHVPSPADSAALQNSGVKLVAVDQALIDGLKAAAASVGGGLQASGKVTGILTVGP